MLQPLVLLLKATRSRRIRHSLLILVAMSNSMESHFKGYARIRLDCLHFESGRATNNKNIKRLLCIFRTEGCHQYDPIHSIPVVMTAGVLASALHTKGLDSSVLYTSATSSPRLDFLPGVKITCLHGKHRVQAAMKFLKPPYQWWNVRIYDEGKRGRDSSFVGAIAYHQASLYMIGEACRKNTQIRSSFPMVTSSDTWSTRKAVATNVPRRNGLLAWTSGIRRTLIVWWCTMGADFSTPSRDCCHSPRSGRHLISVHWIEYFPCTATKSAVPHILMD